MDLLTSSDLIEVREAHQSWEAVGQIIRYSNSTISHDGKQIPLEHLKRVIYLLNCKEGCLERVSLQNMCSNNLRETSNIMVACEHNHPPHWSSNK